MDEPRVPCTALGEPQTPGSPGSPELPLSAITPQLESGFNWNDVDLNGAAAASEGTPDSLGDDPETLCAGVRWLNAATDEALKRWEMRWLLFFVVVVYSISQLGEFYLSLYLLKGGFQPLPSKALFGWMASFSAVGQCSFFFILDWFWKNVMSPRNGLVLCGLLISLRFFSYAALPVGHVDYVLPVELLHGGVNFGLMSASIKVLGKEASTDNTMAISQALLSAFMYNVSALIGGSVFSYLTTEYEFEFLFLVFGCLLAAFSVVWGLLGHYIREDRRARRRSFAGLDRSRSVLQIQD